MNSDVHGYSASSENGEYHSNLKLEQRDIPVTALHLPNVSMDGNPNNLSNVVATSNSEANEEGNSTLYLHDRKIMRRAANRRSAQLSRARKKVSSPQYIQPCDLNLKTFALCQLGIRGKVANRD